MYSVFLFVLVFLIYYLISVLVLQLKSDFSWLSILFYFSFISVNKT